MFTFLVWINVSSFWPFIIIEDISGYLISITLFSDFRDLRPYEGRCS